MLRPFNPEYIKLTVGHLLSSFVRYPIVNPRSNCVGDKESSPGVRSYGMRPASETYDVYCYIDRLKGMSSPFVHVWVTALLGRHAAGCQRW